MNDIVWARHKNGRYYHAKVEEVKQETRYAVFFPSDQSFSKDIILTDIVDFETMPDGPYEGQRLQIRWIDGQIYTADCMGEAHCFVYTVRFIITNFKNLLVESYFNLDHQ